VIGDILRDIKFSINYFSVDNVDLGKIGEIVVDNANTFDLTYAYGAIKGGDKVSSGLDFDIKVADDIKLVLGGGIENIDYNDAYTSGDSVTHSYYNVGMDYQPDNYNNLSVNYLKNGTFEKYGVNYVHDFGNKVKASLSLYQTHQRQ